MRNQLAQDLQVRGSSSSIHHLLKIVGIYLKLDRSVIQAVSIVIVSNKIKFYIKAIKTHKTIFNNHISMKYKTIEIRYKTINNRSNIIKKVQHPQCKK